MVFLRRSLFISSLVLILAGLVGIWALASDASEEWIEDGCTSIMVGKDATVDGSFITSHTCDGWYDSGLKVIPAADHAPGEMYTVYKDLLHADYKPQVEVGKVPQVAHTYQYFHIGYPIANEFQVIMGEDTITGNKKLRATELSKAFLWIEHLQVLGLQRAKTAREWIQVAGALAEKYGYADGGENLTITDPKEAWSFEIFGAGPAWTPESGKPGAVWCAQRVPDGHIMVEPNMSRIDQVNPKDTENFMCSSNYMSLAVELGLYDPAGGKPFSWRLAYGDLWRASSVSGRWPRLWRAFNLLAPSAAPLRGWQMEDAPNYPFSVKPDKKLSVQDIWAVLNDTNVGTPFDNANDPAWFVRNPAGEWVKSNLATPDPTKELGDLIGLNWYRKGSATGNSYTFISQTRAWLPDAIGGVFWFEHDNAHNGLLVPVFVQNTSTPPSWAVADRTKFDRNSAWWAFGLVDDLVNQRYQVLKPLLEAVRGPLQKEIFDAQAAVEATALAKYNADPASARQYLTEYTNSLMLRVEAAYWALSDQFLYLLNNNKLGSPVRR